MLFSTEDRTVRLIIVTSPLEQTTQHNRCIPSCQHVSQLKLSRKSVCVSSTWSTSCAPPPEVTDYVLKNRKCMIELFAGLSWASQYLWPPGWLVQSAATNITENSAVHHLYFSGECLTLPSKEVLICISCVGAVWGSCVCVCLFLCVCVQQMVSFSQKWPAEEKAEKIKGRETFLSVSNLSCDACWVLFHLLFRKVGGKKRQEAEKLNARHKWSDFIILLYLKQQKDKTIPYFAACGHLVLSILDFDSIFLIKLKEKCIAVTSKLQKTRQDIV